MKRQFRDYQEKLIQDLKDPKLASAYLNEALMDEDPRIFLIALKDVYEAQGEEWPQSPFLIQKKAVLKTDLS